MAGFRGRARRHLSLRGRTWWLKVAIPAAVRHHFDGKTAIVESLETSDLRIAMVRRDQRERDIQDSFTAAKTGRQMEALDRGRLWKEVLLQADPEERDLITDLAREEAERSSDPHKFTIGFTGREAVGARIDDWLREAGLADKTTNEWRGLVLRFDRWATAEGLTVSDFDRKTAGRYVGEELAPMDRGTAGKHLSAIRGYWAYLVRRGHATEETTTIWDKQLQPQRGKKGKKKSPERAFTTEELNAVLHGHHLDGKTKVKPGQFDTQLQDAGLIAALSGMRLAETVTLEVGHCANGWFDLQDSKTQAGIRRVPIHSGLVELVRRRTQGKKPTDLLFHELAADHKRGKAGAVSTKQFTRYREKLGVDDVRPGKRRSLVNFHSYRRWFITQAEQAGQPEGLVSVIVGHEEGRQKGFTFGAYSGGPSEEQMRECVEAVKLPREAVTSGAIVGQ